MKRILVTGSNGQLGNEIKRQSRESGQEFIFTNAAELDITNKKQVEEYISQSKPDFLINCAAYTNVEKAEDDESSARRINALAPGYLAESCDRHNVKMIQISTDYVFDGTNYRPYNEVDAVNPLSAYGRTKLEGESLVKLALNNSMIIRTSWLYSIFGNNFVKTMIRLGKEKKELTVVNDQVGTPTNAADLAKLLVLIVIEDGSGKSNFIPGIYHFSNEGVCSWYDFARTIMELGGINCKVLPVESKDYPTRVIRPFYSVLNKAKVRNTFGVEVPYWKDSLEKCLKELINK